MDNNVLSITDKILKEVSKVVVGKKEIKELLLVALLRYSQNHSGKSVCPGYWG